MRIFKILVIAVLGTLTACERATEESAELVAEKWFGEQGREATVEIDRDQGTIRVDLGAARRPRGWPEDVPIDSETLTAKVNSTAKEALSLELHSRKEVSQLSADYLNYLTESGWALDHTDGSEELRAHKDGRTLIVTFAPTRGIGLSVARVEISDQSRSQDSGEQHDDEETYGCFS